MHRGTIRTLTVIALFVGIIVSLLLALNRQNRSNTEHTLYFPDQPPTGTYPIIGYTLGYDSDDSEDITIFEADPEKDGTYAGYRVFTRRTYFIPDAPSPRAQYASVENRDGYTYTILHVYLP